MGTELQQDELWLRDLLRQAEPPPANPEFRDKLRRRVLLAAEDQAREMGQAPLRRRRLLRWLTLPLAAGLLLVCGLLWLSVGPVEQAQAFAAVQRELRNRHSVSYRVTWTVPSQPPLVVDVWAKRPGKVRQVQSDGKVNIWDMQSGSCFGFSPVSKRAYLLKGEQHDSVQWVIDRLEHAATSEGRYVGPDTVEDQRADLYHLEADGQVLKVWVDPASMLPVRIVASTILGGSAEAQFTFDHFRWDDPLDDSLFTFSVPNGYSLNSFEGTASESSVADLLQLLASLDGSRFPQRLDLLVVLDQIKSDQQRRTGEQPSTTIADDGLTLTKLDELSKQRLRLARSAIHFTLMQQPGTWEYLGSGRQLGDKSAVICRWKPQGSSEYRAIMGDLSIRTLPAGSVTATN